MSEKLFDIATVADETSRDITTTRVLGDPVLTVKPSPREEFLRGIFSAWGYSKTKAADAARAAMEKLG